MSDTTTSTPSSTLRLERRHTRAGVHPYDDVSWETRVARVGRPGEKPRFEQHGVEVPATWSQNATDIVAQKYFAYGLDDPRRENSVRQLIDRVVKTIGAAGMRPQPETDRPYFLTDEEREIFEAELTHILVHQKAAFNSPVWFNVGVEGAAQQCSACFILSVEDDLTSISEWYAKETIIFKRGSGSGINLSNLRGSVEQLALGGHSSGPVTFMRAGDANAGTIQSGGTCLAPTQRVYTAEKGPVSVQELATAHDFTVLSYDPPAGRYKAKTARAWKTAPKQVMRVHTDKGQFDLTHDHPVRLSSDETLRVEELVPGMFLFACAVDQEDGSLCVHLRDGHKGKAPLHRLATDVLKESVVQQQQHQSKNSRDEDAANDHRVISVENLGIMDVYDVEVDCPTPDDKSSESGHNFVIWPDDDSTGSGIAVFNTRRAAKLVALNIDHPDVEDFIWCKAREEDRIRVLKAAGLEIGIGSDIGEKNLAEATAYQNANNSVRVTQAFLDAVEADGDWDFLGRLTGAPTKTVKARKLMRELAEAAWRCADPGVQYDTTINDWHTTPAQGPITASNPCCFVGETLVETEHGRVTIDELQADYATGHALPRAYAFDTHSRLTVLRLIKRAWVSGSTAQLLDVVTSGGLSLRCTPEHRFMLHNGEYVQAQDLTPGVRLRKIAQRTQGYERSLDNEVVVSATPVTLAESVPVYDLEVEGTHNFTVASMGSAASVVVHNSEYMSNDDTSCNLASLNLLKFLKQDGTFDVEDFQFCTRLMFIAQDITISFGDFPTELIGDNSRKFRQIGTGYANLGALLMGLGLPYDSDEGRAIASSITALMTGECYLQSTYLAERVGPFHYYADNVKPMQRVMRKHREKARELATGPENLVVAAQKVWNDVVRRGNKIGFRNAQSTVLAPTGCLVADSLISTSQGLVRLHSLGDTEGAQWQDLDLQVATDEGPRQATKFYINGLEQVVSIETARGYRIQGTPTHRLKVVDENGQWAWKRLAEVGAGDHVPMMLNSLVGEPREVVLPPLADLNENWPAVPVTNFPQVMSPELAEFLGYFMGDGALRTSLLLRVPAGEDEVIERLRVLGEELFGLEAQTRSRGQHTEVRFPSLPLVAWWREQGFAKLSGEKVDGSPYVPDAILHSNDRSVYTAFLRGLFAAAAPANEDGLQWATSDERFIRDVQTLLLTLGLISQRRVDDSRMGARVHLLQVPAARYVSEIGCLSPNQEALLKAVPAPEYGISDGPLQQALLDTLITPESSESSLAQTGMVSRDTATALLERLQNLEPYPLGYIYDEVASTQTLEDQPTFDLAVPDNVTYVADGFVSHNTIAFMMDCDTTGVEPDFSLVKGKTLAGGGSMVIPNRTLPMALRQLGYSAAQTDAIIEYVLEDVAKPEGYTGPRGSVVGAPFLAEEHYPVFDTAIGARAIAWRGHVDMMGACQPFLSGAISKTVNLPEGATIDEIEEVYLYSGEVGLKAVAVYRDKCKVFQPLGDAKTKDRDAVVEEALVAQKTSILGDGLLRGERRRVARKAPMRGVGFDVGMTSGYISVREFEDGKPGAIFIDVGQAGSTLAGFIKALSITVSLGFQYGVPLDMLVSKLAGMQFEPYGFTNDPEIRQARSLVDYIVKWLALEYLDPSVLPVLGIVSQRAENEDLNSSGDVSPKVEMPARPVDTTGVRKDVINLSSSEKFCDVCGSLMQPTGACYTCTACGASSGGCG